MTTEEETAPALGTPTFFPARPHGQNGMKLERKGEKQYGAGI